MGRSSDALSRGNCLVRVSAVVKIGIGVVYKSHGRIIRGSLARCDLAFAGSNTRGDRVIRAKDLADDDERAAAALFTAFRGLASMCARAIVSFRDNYYVRRIVVNQGA